MGSCAKLQLIGKGGQLLNNFIFGQLLLANAFWLAGFYQLIGNCWSSSSGAFLGFISEFNSLNSISLCLSAVPRESAGSTKRSCPSGRKWNGWTAVLPAARRLRPWTQQYWRALQRRRRRRLQLKLEWIVLTQLRIREPMTSGGQWTSDDDDDDEGRISGGPYPVIRTIKFIIKGKFKHNSSALYGHHVSTQQTSVCRSRDRTLTGF